MRSTCQSELPKPDDERELGRLSDLIVDLDRAVRRESMAEIRYHTHFLVQWAMLHLRERGVDHDDRS